VFPVAISALLALAQPARVYGLHVCEVCIRGNHLDAVTPLFKRLKYRQIGPVRTVNSKRAMALLDESMPNDHRVRKAAYFMNGWTHIVDPEFVIPEDEKAMASFSRSLKTTVITWVSESTSDSYGFSQFENGKLNRSQSKTKERPTD
jgi:hypothetical protein